MKMKKFWKRFWTMNRRHAGGFTLVELIVVIAILAILGGVAVPAYSGYVKKANMGVDETLAGEIKHAMLMAHYSGKLTPGDYVVISPNAAASASNSEDNAITTAEAAMSAAFGADWNSLRLAYDGWSSRGGVVYDATMMGHVSTSRFNKDSLESLLDDVQTVVNAASGYLVDYDATVTDPATLKYLEQVGYDISGGVRVTEANKNAVANALVFATADDINSMDSDVVNDFYVGWICDGNFGSNIGLNSTSMLAAKYASALAVATYLDNAMQQGGFTSNYVQSVRDAMTSSGLDQVDRNIDAALANMRANTEDDDFNTLRDASAMTYYGAGNAGESGISYNCPAYSDAMSFLAYMDGVTSSSDSMMENNDLNKEGYFNDGDVLSYVNSYIDAGTILKDINASEGSFVIIYDGSANIRCVPLDY